MCKISILMPVYNGEKYLREAIDSILNQTLKDFELIIINDCSSDDTVNIVRSYNDNRIVLINNKKNLGIAETLNKGIDISKGKYIARMDADDICYPKRLEIQYNFMENNIDIGMCGSHVEVFTEQTNQIHRCPIKDNEIKVLQIFNSAFTHPAVMIRKSVLKDYNLKYDKFYEGMEDYELWIRISKVSKLANIDDILLRYRNHLYQVTKRVSDKQFEKMILIREKTLQELSSSFTKEDAKLLMLYSNNDIFKYPDRIYRVFDLFTKIIEYNKESKIYHHKTLKYVISYNVYWSLLKCKNEYGVTLKYKNYKRLMNPITKMKALIKIG